MPLAKFRHKFLDRPPPRLPHNVANEEKFHCA
jgi:hypothetical protein